MDQSTPDQQNFQVDLRGVVELLSHNLYSGPRVFVREVLQNGLDAITARRSLQPNAPGRVCFVTSGQTLRVSDSGVGLSLEEAKQLLSTIGATSKRDEWGMARSDYLGQFGIGLLSCFMVSRDITVYSRSAREENATTIKWVGRPDGTWSVGEAEVPMEEPGTVIELRALPGDRYFEAGQLRSMISEYGRYLPIEVTLQSEGAFEVETLTGSLPPWELDEVEAGRWCATNFGFHPFASFPLEVPGCGLVGRAFVLPDGAHPGQALRHLVYLRRMLLSARVTDLLPEWAYFVRVAVDAKYLKPTASREDLFDDDLLEECRQHLGQQVRDWLGRLAEEDPGRFSAFVSVHLNGLKSLALHDAQTRKLVCSTVPFQTSLGTFTLDEILERYGAVRYTRTNDQYQSLAAVAQANDLCIVNAGYAFDQDLLGQVMLDRPAEKIQLFDPAELLQTLRPLSALENQALAALLRAAGGALEGQQLEVVGRSFEPANLPALYLPDPDIAGQVVADSARTYATGAWEGLLDVVDPFAGAASPRLILNAQSELINRLAAATDPHLVDTAIRGLYVQALLSGRHPMNPQAKAWMNNLFTTLIQTALRP